MVQDTPQQDVPSSQTSPDAPLACDAGIDVCPSLNQGAFLPNNFMDYSNCRDSFTPGQAARMFKQVNEYRRVIGSCGTGLVDVVFTVELGPSTSGVLGTFTSWDRGIGIPILHPDGHPLIPFGGRTVSRRYCVSSDHLYGLSFENVDSIVAATATVNGYSVPPSTSDKSFLFYADDSYCQFYAVLNMNFSDSPTLVDWSFLDNERETLADSQESYLLTSADLSQKTLQFSICLPPRISYFNVSNRAQENSNPTSYDLSVYAQTNRETAFARFSDTLYGASSREEVFDLTTPEPTAAPSAPPTLRPSRRPTLRPSPGPTLAPSEEPSRSTPPSIEPTVVPTMSPTRTPSQRQTSLPTPVPTELQIIGTESPVEPAFPPTGRPSQVPTQRPIPEPTANPTPAPTVRPTAASTGRPTPLPTPIPTELQNEEPSDEEPSSVVTGWIDDLAEFSCFSSSNTVEIRGKGSMPIEFLTIGDWVKVSEVGKYSRVYSLAHRDHKTSILFLQIYSEGRQAPIEISERHMLFVDGKPIMAKDVKIGDLLNGALRVTRITVAKNRGLYAPLTEDGEIVVSGVKSSCYSSVLDIPLSLQISLYHWWLLPLRVRCQFDFGSCRQERYTQGFSERLFWLLSPARQLSSFHPSVQLSTVVLFLVATVCMAFKIMRFLWAVCRREYFSQKL